MKTCSYDHDFMDGCYCPECGYEEHHFRDEPYCELCGKPYSEWFAAIKGMLKGGDTK